MYRHKFFSISPFACINPKYRPALSQEEIAKAESTLEDFFAIVEKIKLPPTTMLAIKNLIPFEDTLTKFEKIAVYCKFPVALIQMSYILGLIPLLFVIKTLFFRVCSILLWLLGYVILASDSSSSSYTKWQVFQHTNKADLSFYFRNLAHSDIRDPWRLTAIWDL